MVRIIVLSHAFHFQVQKAALPHGIIPTIALATHAAADALLIEEALILEACILAATIRMLQQSRCRFALLNCHTQCRGDKWIGRVSAIAQPTILRENRSRTPQDKATLLVCEHR